ncbi:hypothetical protein B0J14DRAFT_586480 [Halenospora varia]|nr:hypothetical protein B0J14DRAFT_586480 [Halenospora varia]
MVDPHWKSQRLLDGTSKVWITPADRGLAYPIFFDVRGTYDYLQPGGTSRGNSYYIHVAIQKLRELLALRGPDGRLKFTSADILLVIPYLTAQAEWKAAFARPQNADLRQALLMTPEAATGWDRPLALWDLVVSANGMKSFGWVANRKRVTVCLTRPKSGLIIVGDSGIVHESLFRDPMRMPASRQEQRLLSSVFSWLNKRGRVVKVDAWGLKTSPHLLLKTPRVIAEEQKRYEDRQKEVEREQKKQGF